MRSMGFSADLSGDLRREDFWRGTAASDRHAAPFREWMHIIVVHPGLELLINFNHRAALAGEEGTARVLVLARTEQWTGFIATEPAIFTANGTEARFGRHRFRVLADGWQVEVDAPEHGFSAKLHLHPLAHPMIARGEPIAAGRRLDWAMYARIVAHGSVELDGRHFMLDGAAAYHDHNWGHFAWGDDFSWEWGVFLPEDPHEPWTMVFSNLQNRAGTLLSLQQVFLWRSEHNLLAASGIDICVQVHGRQVDPRPFRLPQIMSLLVPAGGADLPRSLEITARRPGKELALTVDLDAWAQLLIPAETDPLGTVVLNECVGPAELSVKLGETCFTLKGRCVFEFLQS